MKSSPDAAIKPTVANLIPADKLTPDQIEAVELATMRFVFHAIRDFVPDAYEIFRNSPDDQQEIAEDVTREALGKHPGFPLPERIFGVMDFKRAGYVFLPEFCTRQALLVDSKAEKTANVARLQVSQTSLAIRQIRGGTEVDEKAGLPTVMNLRGEDYLVTTLFVHYEYGDLPSGRELKSITITALPSGRLESLYVPSVTDTIWVAGPNAPTRGEAFRVRLSFSRLKAKMKWRVQKLLMQGGRTSSRWSE